MSGRGALVDNLPGNLNTGDGFSAEEGKAEIPGRELRRRKRHISGVGINRAKAIKLRCWEWGVEILSERE